MTYTRFVIVSHLRSGTHLLRSMLESHPAIVCQSEVFNSDDPNLPFALDLGTREVLRNWVYTDRGAHCEAAGFVLQIYHPGGLKAFPGIRENPAWSDIWDLLAGMPDLRVIHLRRENGLARHLSHVLARRTGQWHRWDPERLDSVTHLHKPETGRNEDGGRPMMSLDEDRLRVDFEEVEALHRAVAERFGGGHYFPLSYEGLCRDPGSLGSGLLEFLGVDPFDLTPAVSKLETRPLSLRISNFSELKRAFSNTRWARFFEEEEP